MFAEKKKTSPLIIVAATVIGSVVGSLVVQQVSNRPPTTERILVQTSNEMNKTLPMMIDQITRLDATYPGPGKVFNYRYTLVGLKAADLKAQEIKDSLEPMLFQNYKTHPAMKDLRDLTTVLKYHYFDDSGAFIVEIEIDPKRF